MITGVHSPNTCPQSKHMSTGTDQCYGRHAEAHEGNGQREKHQKLQRRRDAIGLREKVVWGKGKVKMENGKRWYGEREKVVWRKGKGDMGKGKRWYGEMQKSTSVNGKVNTD